MRLLTSLQSAFSLYFIAAAIVPLLVFGLFADRYLTDLHLKQVEQELSLQTLDIRDATDVLLRQMRGTLFLARARCETMRVIKPGEIDGLLRDIVKNTPELLSIYLLDERKHIQHLGLAERLSGLENDFRGLDLSGQALLAKVESRHLGESDEVRWSDVFVSMVTGEPTVNLALPIDHGMLLGTVSVQSLCTSLGQRVTQREGIEFAIIDHHGTLVAHSNPALAMQRTNVRANHPEIVDALTTGREVPIKHHEDDSLLESTRVITGPKWVVHASQSRALALEPMRKVRTFLMLAVSFGLFGGISLAMWLSRRISRPLRRLHETAGALALGDYEKASSLKGARFSEVDDLSTSFRRMARTVREREQTLAESEGRFRSLVEGMGEGLMIIDSSGMVSEANHAAERILGLKRNELVGVRSSFSQWRTIREDGSGFPEEEHPARTTLREGVPVSNQVLGLQRPDGRECWIQVNSRPIHNARGDVDKVLITFSEVTGLKIAEEALRLSKMRFQELYQQFSALLEGITDRIVLISRDWKLLWTNQDPGGGCIAIEAVSSGSCCFSEYFNRDTPCPGCPAKRAFANGEPAFGEMSGPQGRSWNLRAFPVFGKGGAVNNVVMIAADITDKRESERQRIRAGQLAALGELAAGVAHEINNPISGVINYAQLILNRAEEGSRERELAQRIIKEGDRIATIVRELLTFAREENAEIHLVSIREALAEALALCEAPLRKEAVDLHIDLPADLPPVESRSHQIQQLFLNLISNSRHALSEKYPQAHPDKQLLISGRLVEVEGCPVVRLQVRDHGTGIPAELLERVMNPFVTTKPAGVGTGLGLSISFEIVKKHGGTLSIASEYGAWTEIMVDLPASTVHGVAKQVLS